MARLPARVGPGQRYGYRVHGPYEPAAGLQCNPAKLLLDPYAKAIDGRNDWNEALFAYRFGDPDSSNDADSAPYAMTSVVINPYSTGTATARCACRTTSRSSTRRTSRA